MTGVLMVLALLSIVGGLVGLPYGALGIHGPNPFQRWLSPVLLPIAGEPFEFHHASVMADWILILLSVAVAVTGILIARRFYFQDLSWSRPKAIAARYPFLYRLVENKYYVDEFYDRTVIGGTMALSRRPANSGETRAIVRAMAPVSFSRLSRRAIADGDSAMISASSSAVRSASSCIALRSLRSKLSNMARTLPNFGAGASLFARHRIGDRGIKGH